MAEISVPAWLMPIQKTKLVNEGREAREPDSDQHADHGIEAPRCTEQGPEEILANTLGLLIDHVGRRDAIRRQARTLFQGR